MRAHAADDFDAIRARVDEMRGRSGGVNEGATAVDVEYCVIGGVARYYPLSDSAKRLFSNHFIRTGDYYGFCHEFTPENFQHYCLRPGFDELTFRRVER